MVDGFSNSNLRSSVFLSGSCYCVFEIFIVFLFNQQITDSIED